MGINYSEAEKRFKIDSFGKYITNDDKIINGIFEYHKIRFTQPGALNDPLEFNPIIKFKRSKFNPYNKYVYDEVYFPDVGFFHYKAFIEPLINKYGVLSLTKVPDSFYMWNMYGNGHKGLFIEFSMDFNNHPCMLSIDKKPYEIKEVKYKDDYSIEVDQIVTAKTLDNKNLNILNEVLNSKTSRWKKEEEYRLVRNLNDHPNFHISNSDEIYLFDFSLECISSVIFGASMPIKDKEFIKDKCRNLNIEFYQAFIIRDQKDFTDTMGKVVIHKIEGDDEKFSWQNIIKMDPSLFIGSLEELEGKDIYLGNLKDLPYYHGNEEFVIEWYKYFKNIKGN
jgi:Protein of unknown function (DUF2971)